MHSSRLVEAFVALAEDVLIHDQPRWARRRIYAYLRDKHANFDVNPIGTLISYMKRLEGIKIGQYEAG